MRRLVWFWRFFAQDHDRDIVRASISDKERGRSNKTSIVLLSNKIAVLSRATGWVLAVNKELRDIETTIKSYASGEYQIPRTKRT